jgi:hypothetical protein
VQYLAVAGGGSGGGSVGGGGGAGGVLQGIAQVTSGTTYTITVGSGGAAVGTQVIGNSGVDSVISGTGLTTIDAVGGGGGGYSHSGSGGAAGLNGGSGGGGSGWNGVLLGGTGTTGQGYGGGSGGASSYCGAGGGGYGMLGFPAVSSTVGGNGGDGFTTYIANPATYSWSNYFNGSSWFNFGSSSNFAFGTNAYTIEMWVYITGKPNLGVLVCNSNTNGIDFYINYSNNTTRWEQRAGSSIIAFSGTPALNTWTHIALVRTGTGSNQTTLYFNGVSQGTGTDATNWSVTGNLYVANDAQGSSTAFNGYISNLRIVNGTAVYTSNFTPSTTPLTAITNTVLLTCQSGSFSDASTNNFTATLAGSPYIASQNPFGASYAGGGGGGANSAITYGGMGGGASGANNVPAGSSAAANTGAGGGGGFNFTGSGGGAGGSGVVILAYPSTYSAASSVTGSPTVTTTGGYRVYTFTGGGTITF